MSMRDWNITAPSMAEFEAMARQALSEIPPELLERCDGLVLQVAEYADEHLLDALEIEDALELTGVYHGVDLTQKSIADPNPQPDIVQLFRLPILCEWAEAGDIPLGELITHVLIHEIGHHFGFSDADMDALQG